MWAFIKWQVKRGKIISNVEQMSTVTTTNLSMKQSWTGDEIKTMSKLILNLSQPSIICFFLFIFFFFFFILFFKPILFLLHTQPRYVSQAFNFFPQLFDEECVFSGWETVSSELQIICITYGEAKENVYSVNWINGFSVVLCRVWDSIPVFGSVCVQGIISFEVCEEWQ